MNYMRNRIQIGDAAMDWFRRHPTVVLSIKASLAAGLAWVVVRPLGGVADDYPYYAPLGAVIATSATLARSVRDSARALTAIGLGAGVALLAQAPPLPQLVALVLATGVGVAVGSWHLLGRRASWVPVTALFVLLVGDAHPWHYALGYAGLTALGAFVGIAVDAAVPQRPKPWREAGNGHPRRSHHPRLLR
jgi:uncharacterized membrane protein YgaE (UPF0421/DUF939 family)